MNVRPFPVVGPHTSTQGLVVLRGRFESGSRGSEYEFRDNGRPPCLVFFSFPGSGSVGPAISPKMIPLKISPCIFSVPQLWAMVASKNNTIFQVFAAALGFAFAGTGVSEKCVITEVVLLWSLDP